MNAGPVARWRHVLIPLGLALLVARCADESGPHLTAAQFSVNGGQLPGAVRNRLSLDRYTATFWAVRGEQRSVQINYLGPAGQSGAPFLRLENVEPSFVPGRGGLMPHDSVLITVTVDPYLISVSLEPTGLLFAEPAQLTVSYRGAGGDLDGDDVVNDTDVFIESQLLGVWYREHADQAWTRLSAVQSVSERSFTIALQHFSQYAVSW